MYRKIYSEVSTHQWAIVVVFNGLVGLFSADHDMAHHALFWRGEYRRRPTHKWRGRSQLAMASSAPTYIPLPKIYLQTHSLITKTQGNPFVFCYKHPCLLVPRKGRTYVLQYASAVSYNLPGCSF